MRITSFFEDRNSNLTVSFADMSEEEYSFVRQLVFNVLSTATLGLTMDASAATTTEEATPKKRKRRTKAEIEADEAAAAAESEETSGKDTASIPAPEKKHRRRTSDDDQKPESDDSVRRPRSKSKDEPKAEAAAEGDSDFTDEDLSKMVSEAAREIGPDAVMEVLETFGVVATSDLKPKFRAQFAAKLTEKIEAESD